MVYRLFCRLFSTCACLVGTCWWTLFGFCFVLVGLLNMFWWIGLLIRFVLFGCCGCVTGLFIVFTCVGLSLVGLCLQVSCAFLVLADVVYYVCFSLLEVLL